MTICEQSFENSARFFRNTACQHFPCHKGVDPAEFNCLFCYCPLYALGPDCGGNYTYSSKGVKNCTGCTLLHKGDAGADIVKQRFKMLVDLARHPDDSRRSANTVGGPERDKSSQAAECEDEDRGRQGSYTAQDGNRCECNPSAAKGTCASDSEHETPAKKAQEQQGPSGEEQR